MWHCEHTGCDWQSTNLDLLNHKFPGENHNPCTGRKSIYFFQDSPNEPIICLIFPPTAESSDISGDMKQPHIPGPAGSCDNRLPPSKSSLDQTTASCTLAKKQSPKYVYPGRGAPMLIKMSNFNQLMWMHVMAERFLSKSESDYFGFEQMLRS